MTATPEQRSRASDPATPAETLASLAHAERELWPLIAGHPNVYPELLEWMRAYGLDDSEVETEVLDHGPGVPQSVEVPSTAPTDRASSAPLTKPLPPLGVTRPAVTPAKAWGGSKVRRTKLLWLLGAVLVVTALVVTLVVAVVVPQQRAAEEAAAALKAEERKHSAAVTQFANAELKCDMANDGLKTSLDKASELLALGPAALTDPSLLTALADALTGARAATFCNAPTMASAADAIEKQALALSAAANPVIAARDDLKKVVDAVDGDLNAQAAAQRELEAQKRAQEEALAKAARSWTFTDSQGFTFESVVDVKSPTGTYSETYGSALEGTRKTYNLGDACRFDPARDIAVPVEVTSTARTAGFDTVISYRIAVSALGDFMQVRSFSIETYYTGGASCESPSTNWSGATAQAGVKFTDPVKTGSSGKGTHVVIIHDWKTPNAPDGDSAALAKLRVTLTSTDYSGSGSKGVLLNNQPFN